MVAILLRNALDTFFNRMNYLNGLLHHLDVQLRAFRDSTRERISSGAVQPAHFAAGSSLVIRDLTEWPSYGAVYYSSGRFGTRGQDFLNCADELISREAAWAVAQGFEAFESCVKDLLAVYLHAHPVAADPSILCKEKRSLRRSGLDPSSPDFWLAFVRRRYRSVEDVLRTLRQDAPQILDAEQKNNYACDLSKWFAAVSRVRHAVTHSNLTISKTIWNAVPPDEQQITEELFSGLTESGAYKLRPTVRQATEALKRLTEYGYSAFKALCIAGGHEWRIFHRQGTQ